MARMGALKRAAQQLGISSTLLRQHGWKTASPERIRAVTDNPPDWLVEARDRRDVKRARQQRLRDRKDTAARLGIQVRAVAERDIRPEDVGDLLAALPEWLIAEQLRRHAQVEREAKDRLGRELTDALVLSVHDAWFQQLKRATSHAEVDAIDAQWAPEVQRVKAEARQMVDELSPEQLRARIDRDRDAANQAGVYRAAQLARRAFGGDSGG